MDKTLESIQLIHRVLMSLTLALALLSISAEQPDDVYENARDDLSRLQEAVRAAKEFRDKGNSEISHNSDLIQKLAAWRESRNLTKGISLEIIDPDDVAVPDPEINSRVTVATQVLWADRIYDRVDSPYYICNLEQGDLFRALDAHVGRRALLGLSVKLDMKQTFDNFVSKYSSQCVLTVRYPAKVTEKGLEAEEVATFATPGRLLSISGFSDAEGNHMAMILKDHGLGDYEAGHQVVVNSIRALWSEISGLVPPSADNYLMQKADEELEKRKTHIDLLGQSVSASLSLMGGSLVLLFLLMFLATHVLHVKNILVGNERAIKEFPLFGLMWSNVGLLLSILTVIVFPVAVCYFCLMVVVPAAGAAGLRAGWVVNNLMRWTLLFAVAAISVAVVVTQVKIVTMVRLREDQAPVPSS